MTNQKGIAHLALIVTTLLILAGIGIAVYLTQFTQVFKPRALENQINTVAEHIIGKTMIDGKPFLYNKASGRIFIPRGNNYSNKETSSWNWFTNYESKKEKIERDFSKMEQDGYNTIRLGVDGNSMVNSQGKLDPQVLSNMADFLQKAKNHHIFVYLSVAEWPAPSIYHPADDFHEQNPLINPRVFCGRDHPQYNLVRATKYGCLKDDDPNLFIDPANFNYHYMSPVALQTRIRYWKDLINGLRTAGAPLDAILAYDVTGTEVGFNPDYKPFEEYSGPIMTNAGQYHIPAPSERNYSAEVYRNHVKRLANLNIIVHVNALHDAIKEVDPTALTSIQVFPPALETPPGQEGNAATSRFVPAKWLTASVNEVEEDLRGVKTDLIGLSLYPNTFGKNFDCQISSLEIPGIGGSCNYPLRPGNNTKPIMVVEMGYYSNQEQTPVNPSFVTPTEAALRLKDWMLKECNIGIRGWNLFTWDTTFNSGTNVSSYYHALQDAEAINNVLKPVNFPNVCGDNLDSGPGVSTGKVDSIPIYDLREKANQQNRFYTASDNEKDNLLKTGQWYYGSNTWYSSTKPGDGLKPVYALSLKSYGGTHMYTISESEKQQLINTGLWEDQGIVWYSSEEPREGLIPVFRFKSKTDDNLNFFIAQPLGFDETGKRNMADQGWIYEEDKNPVWYDSQFETLTPVLSPGSPSPSPSNSQKIGDLNGDGNVTLADFNAFARLYKTKDLAADFNGNGGVDLADLNMLIRNFGN